MADAKSTIDSLEETMEDVIETLDIAERMADNAASGTIDPAQRARAKIVRDQAEAMLEAAEEVRPDMTKIAREEAAKTTVPYNPNGNPGGRPH